MRQVAKDAIDEACNEFYDWLADFEHEIDPTNDDECEIYIDTVQFEIQLTEEENKEFESRMWSIWTGATRQ